MIIAADARNFRSNRSAVITFQIRLAVSKQLGNIVSIQMTTKSSVVTVESRSVASQFHAHVCLVLPCAEIAARSEPVLGTGYLSTVVMVTPKQLKRYVWMITDETP
jgi:hypothetical protein